MKSNIFEKLGVDSGVFKDERHLYPDFVPEKLLHREKEIENLARIFNLLVKGRKPHNVLITGPTGVGKTTVARFVLSQAEEFTDRVKSLYLNCFEFNSRHSVLSGITNFLGRASPRRGIATDEIYTSMLESLNKATFSPIIVLDEADQLFVSSEGQKLLYDLLRVIEFGKNSFCLVLISNNESLAFSLDERVRSSLGEETIKFSPYSPEQLKDIFHERVNLAFLPSTVEGEVIGFVAAKCALLGGDCRIGIETLLKAGREAEKQGVRKVTLVHAKKAFESVEGVSLLKGVKYLSNAEKTILSVVAKNSEIKSGKIFELFSESFSHEMSERRLRDLLTGLEKKGFLLSEQITLGNQGKTRSFKCRVPSDLLLKEISKN